MKRLLLMVVMLLMLTGCGTQTNKSIEGNNLILPDCNRDNIKVMYFYNPAKYITVTEKDDFDKVLNIVHFLKLKELNLSEDEIPAGSAFLVKIEKNDGTKTDANFLDGKATSDTSWYTVEEKYLPKLFELFDQLSSKYGTTAA